MKLKTTLLLVKLAPVTIKRNGRLQNERLKEEEEEEDRKQMKKMTEKEVG